VLVEQKFEKDIVEVLKATTRLFNSVETQSQALDISVPHLYTWIQKYLGLTLTEAVRRYGGRTRKSRQK